MRIAGTETRVEDRWNGDAGGVRVPLLSVLHVVQPVAPHRAEVEQGMIAGMVGLRPWILVVVSQIFHDAVIRVSGR